ncbi:unnamed protein product [Rhizoctonia solani]|uniref:Uncharacterized protein n=1 Tax=Rhizoctonia solani TaxID=456999 RepID=A0A8H2XG27_9AGAM|nr:unnamed protein product [Rhizoctonia solani]
MKLPPPPLAKWQFWISLTRLLISLVEIGLNILFICYILANPGVVATEVPPLVYLLWFVYSIVATLNDLFMLTIDFKRTNMYLGCIAAQSAINVALISLSIYVSVAQWGTVNMLHMIPSSCLLVISLWPIVRLRTSVPITQIWKINTKDAFSGTVPSGGLYTPSILGRRREAIISRPFPTPVSAYRSIKQFLINLFFRRVK